MAGRPSAEVFGRVCALVDEAEEAAPGLYGQRWRGYLLGHMGRWQARHCAVALERREEAERVAERPWAELVKGVDLTRFDLSDREDVSWVAGELRERFPGLEHLGVVWCSIRKAAVARACEAGVFDGLRSVSFARVGLHVATLGVVLDRLEARGEVEHLSVVDCGMSKAPIERILETSLAPRLRTLALSGNAKFNSRHARALAARAGEFEALERLELAGCSVVRTGAKLLAAADWPDSLTHMNMNQNGIQADGIFALLEHGRLGLLVEEGSERALDLSRQQIGDAAFEAIVDAGVLEGVGRLSLFDCELTSLEPLRRAEGLERVRELDLFENEWGESEDGSALLEAIEVMEQLESLRVQREGLGEAFVERLLEWPGSQRMRRIVFEHYATCTARDVEAALAWGRGRELDRFVMFSLLPSDLPLTERALRSKMFTTNRRLRHTAPEIVIHADWLVRG
jgi:hypothetical protein